jgi:hypothetical protein
MNHLDYFSDKNLAIDLADNENLKIKGLSSLPGSLRNQVLKYAKNHKQKILIELCMQGKSIQGKESIVSCPARCKRTGKCYGRAWFDAKPGKAQPCVPSQCPWNDQLKQYLKRKTDNGI